MRSRTEKHSPKVLIFNNTFPFTSHNVILVIKISFYTKQCEIERWSVRELQRQMKSMLFHRLALSKDKEGVLALAHKGVEVQKPADIIRDPMVLGMYRKRYRTYRNSSWCLQRRNNSRICPSGDYESIVCHKVSTVFTRSTIIEG